MSSVNCKAVCVLYKESSATTTPIGTLCLQQQADGSVHITGTLTGLVANAKQGLAVCVSGDLSNGATSCGPIFNPFGKSHGAPEDDNRMVGDLGNVTVDENGTASVDITDTNITLVGPHSILGRSMVLHVGEDDQGRGGHETSLTNGNPGPRMAAGVIGLSVTTN